MSEDQSLTDARRSAKHPPIAQCDPRVGRLVKDLIGRTADKWTMIALEALADHGELRFSQLARLIDGISQKMLTQTLRLMERDGLVIRTIHPVIPPRVDYRLTDRGRSLGSAFCGVWSWADQHLEAVEASRRTFDSKDVSSLEHGRDL